MKARDGKPGNLILSEKRPRGGQWTEIRPAARLDPAPLAQSWWLSGRVLAISTLVMADLPDGAGVGPQWQLSVSEGGGRPSRLALRQALRAFDLLGAEEDNHHPGIARHFWRPVDPRHRVDCECKTTDVVVVERDGYRWSNDRAPEACRGCEFARMSGQPCPMHGGAR